MKPSLLKHMVCPRCGNGLKLAQEEYAGDEIVKGLLWCGKYHYYDIVGSIPKMFNHQGISKEQRQTVETQTEKWKANPEYGYEPNSRRFREKWHLERYGWGDKVGLRAFLAGKRMVLDAGTGMGGYLELYAKYTNGQVFGVDLSDGVKIANERAGYLKNVHIVQGDITKLPFPKGFFDVIISDQVLHHTADTEKSFKVLVEHLAENGEIAIYVYKRKGDAREFCDDGLRKFTTAMSTKDCERFSEAVTDFGKVLSEIDLEMQRWLYWNVMKCFWNEEMDYDMNVMVNYDWYSPMFAWRHTPEEVRRWFAECGLEVTHEDVGDSGISMRGRK